MGIILLNKDEGFGRVRWMGRWEDGRWRVSVAIGRAVEFSVGSGSWMGEERVQ